MKHKMLKVGAQTRIFLSGFSERVALLLMKSGLGWTVFPVVVFVV